MALGREKKNTFKKLTTNITLDEIYQLLISAKRYTHKSIGL